MPNTVRGATVRSRLIDVANELEERPFLSAKTLYEILARWDIHQPQAP